MQTRPAEPGTPGSLCSQQEQALLGHDSSALFSTSAPGCDKLQLGLQSLHNEGPHPAIPKYTVLGDVLAPPILQLLLHVAPPQPHHRPFWGGCLVPQVEQVARGACEPAWLLGFALLKLWSLKSETVIA